MSQLGFQCALNMTYEEAIDKVTQALKAEGFGVLTSIDVQKTMKEKLNADFRKYAILGVCNPPLAHQALTLRPEVGLLLPCNVIVYEEGQHTIVSIIDPLSMINVIQDPALEPVAREAYTRLKRVAEELANT
ncbi:MAG: DUF302 domain-containing protein [Anaerolineales bacterium]|nr:DUF302 domain-containing protein [Anaerolineales bacterium]MDW8448112.1 DUF302 domain-containing protein [Anaerolineales bacterium]